MTDGVGGLQGLISFGGSWCLVVGRGVWQWLVGRCFIVVSSWGFWVMVVCKGVG